MGNFDQKVLIKKVSFKWRTKVCINKSIPVQMRKGKSTP